MHVVAQQAVTEHLLPSFTVVFLTQPSKTDILFVLLPCAVRHVVSGVDAAEGETESAYFDRMSHPVLMDLVRELTLDATDEEEHSCLCSLDRQALLKMCQ